MSKLCRNIIAERMLLYLNSKNELICRNNEGTAVIFENCRDFDAICEKNGCIHIAAVDSSGRLVYIKNIGNRWGKGEIADERGMDNVFVLFESGVVDVFYINGKELFCLRVDDELCKPKLLDAVSVAAMPFVASDGVYYLNEKEELCKNGKVIYVGQQITEIFAKEGNLCIKDGNELKFLSEKDDFVPKILTRKHGNGAGTPIITNCGADLLLRWIDRDTVYFAKKKDNIWQRLEEQQVSGGELKIYKFIENGNCVYDVGYGIGGNHFRIGGKEPVFKGDIPKKSEGAKQGGQERNLKDEFQNMMRMEEILQQIKNIHKKIAEIDGKIEKMNSLKVMKRQREKYGRIGKSNLLNLHKK